MKSPIRGLLLSSLFLTCSVCCFGQNLESRVVVKGGLSTLYALDPLSQSLCFRDGSAGHMFQQREVKNRCSDLNFHNYAANQLSVGIEGGREGVIVDLGTNSDLTRNYGFDDTVGGGQGFASISFAGGKFKIFKDRRAGTMQNLNESEQIFAQPKPSATAPVKLGHIYLLRITDRHDRDFQLLVKLMVVAFRPEESVTLRWEML